MTRPMYAMLSPGRCCLIWLLFVFLHDCGVGLPSRLSFCLWLVCCWGWRWNSGLRLDLLDNYYFSPMGIVEGMALCIAGAGDAAAAGPQGPGAGTVGTWTGRSSGGTTWVGDKLALAQARHIATLSGKSSHTLLMGVGGDTMGRFALDADGYTLYGDGGLAGFDTMARRPRAANTSWAFQCAHLGSAHVTVPVPGVELGDQCSASHTGLATLVDVHLSARVSSVGTVTVTAFNLGGAEVTIDDGVLTVVATRVEPL